MFISSVAALAFVASCGRPGGSIVEVRSLTNRLQELTQAPLATSQDGELVVSYAKYTDGDLSEGLVIRNTSDGSVVAEFRSELPVLRATWSPRGDKIAYFKQQEETNRRDFFVWDLRTNKHVKYETPVSYAQAYVRWSPQANRIAFTTDTVGIVIVDIATGKVLVIPEDARGFDWSPDGMRVALFARGAGSVSALRVVEVDRGASVRQISFFDTLTIDNVSWSKGSTILVSSKKSLQGGAKMTVVSAVDPDTESVESVSETSEDLKEVAWLPNGKGLIWHVRNSEISQHLGYRMFGCEERGIQADGVMNYRTLSDDGLVAYASNVSLKNNEMRRIDLKTGVSTRLFGVETAVLAADYSTLKVASSSGGEFPVNAAVVKTRAGYPKRAFIRMHGGDFKATTNDWAETQLYLENGVSVFHLALRPFKGRDDIKDLYKHIVSKIGIPSENVIVLGASTAAAVVIDAVISDPSFTGVGAVIGLMAVPSQTWSAESMRKVRLFAFHGELDRVVSPSFAYNAIKTAVGRALQDDSRFVWYVFPGEDHTLHRTVSLATVHATLLRACGIATEALSVASGAR